MLTKEEKSKLTFNADYEYSDALRGLIYKTEEELSDNFKSIFRTGVFEEKLGLSKERVEEALPVMKKYFSYWKRRPDEFVKFLTPKDSNFKLFFYQKLFLRAAIRHKYMYATFPRAYSKSFLAVLVLVIRCILFPGAKLFIVSGTKEQGAAIAKEKIEELKELFPALKNEINEKKSLYGKDYVRVQFKNGSRLDVVAARNSTRGGRRHGQKIGERHGLMLTVENDCFYLKNIKKKFHYM